MAPRRPTSEEKALWAKATADAKPLKRRTPKTEVPAAAPEKPKPERPAKAPKPSRAAPPAPPAKAPLDLGTRQASGLDKRTAERFRKGQRQIDVRLDLHGMTQDAAWRRLVTTVERAGRDGQRTVLVITGKGSTPSGGVLRSTVPRWLAEPPLKAIVLAHAPAQPKDGGSGALYVLVRRRRD
ncbi:MAG: DNA mismatch repair protein MutS [Alphaproteobacteria bacterium]|nr:DNA mismatch repair protein MutS [Alphaproteobacteria bacterium]